MDYKVTINEFEGPLDLLLHLIKQSDIDIKDIEISKITEQYLNYIEIQERMNLTVSSEYLVMAATLIEMKSNSLLPRPKILEEDEYEIVSKEDLINKLIEYERYKEISKDFKELETKRNLVYTKDDEKLNIFTEEDKSYEGDADLTDLLKAFEKFLERKELEKPLNTKITKKELSVSKRNSEIRNLLKTKKEVKFSELFTEVTKDYVVVTFLSILDLARKNELLIKQDKNFSEIIVMKKDVTHE